MEQNLGSTKYEISEIKADIGVMKSDMAIVKEKVAKIDDLKTNLLTIKKTFSNMSGKLDLQAGVLEELLQMSIDTGKKGEEKKKRKYFEVPLEHKQPMKKLKKPLSLATEKESSAVGIQLEAMSEPLPVQPIVALPADDSEDDQPLSFRRITRGAAARDRGRGRGRGATSKADQGEIHDSGEVFA